jgi:hypothetical protein
MTYLREYDHDKAVLAASLMGLVSRPPQLGVAIFERIKRYRREGMLIARIPAELDTVRDALLEAQKLTGIYGWTLVPAENFVEVVLCAGDKQLRGVRRMLTKRFKTKCTKLPGKLHYIGTDTRQDSERLYVNNIREKAGEKAAELFALVGRDANGNPISQGRR